MAWAVASLVAVTLFAASHCCAQSSEAQRPQPRHAPAGVHKTESADNPARDELTKRILAANAARDSGNPSAVVETNQRLIALALRLVGELRIEEGLYSQAAELYRTSLEYEDIADTHVELAIGDLFENLPEDAILQANQAIATDPNNERAEIALGRAALLKGQAPQAVQAFSRAAQLQPSIETLYSLAISLLATKTDADKQRAIAVFQQMVDMAGDNGSLHVLFGRAYRDAGDMPSAVREFERAIQLDPSTPHAHYFLGLARLALNEWKPVPESEAEFKQELRYHPHDFLATYMLGFLASNERQYQESDKYLSAAAQLNPTWPEPCLYLGLNAYARGDMKTAEEMLRKAITLTGSDESRSNYQIRRAYVDLARILASSNREQEADTYVAKAHDLQNKVMRQTQQSVTSMVESSGGMMAAMVPLDKQRENQEAPQLQQNGDPFARVDATVLAHTTLTDTQRTQVEAEEKNLRLVLGQSFSDLATSEAIQAQYVLALSHFQQAERWDSSVPDLQRKLGQSAFRAKNYTEAIRGLSQALNAKPDSAPIRAMLGMSYFALEKFDLAASTFAPLGVPGMRDSEVGYAWASSLTRINDLKKASEVLKQYEEGQLSNDALLLTGELWMDIGDYSSAVEVLHRASQADPNLPKAHFYAGEADIHWEHWPQAAEEFQQELAIAPTNLEAKYNLGFVYLQQSRVDDAVKLFEEVIAANPEHVNAQYELGKVLLGRGQVSEAIPHLEVAARLSPDKAYVHYQLQAAYRKAARNADADRELAVYSAIKAKSHGPVAAPTNP